jgi:uncharacterized protein involved in type VI secretion and phage assembly
MGAPPDKVGGTGERLLVDEILEDDRQAETIAQAQLDVHAAREVTLSGVAEGNPALRPGTRIKVEGIAAPLAGRYVLTAVDHTVDSVKGFVSTISTVPPAPRATTVRTTAAIGVVTHVNDPESFGRVQVKLPTYDDVETDWMCVMTAGAGASKGIVTLPDVGDTVLVFFPNGDPAHGVVLGGLYGVQRLEDWDWGVEGEAVRRYTFLTPGGQRLKLDDVKQMVRFENSNGSYVELAPERVLLHSQTDLQIEAPGRHIVVKGQAIDFEQG